MFRALVRTLAFTLALTSPLQAQRLSFDLRASVASPTQDLAGTNLDPGIGLGATLAFRLQPHLHIFTGWDWVHFAAESAIGANDMDLEETGYSLGLRFVHPLGMTSRLSYRLEGAATYKHIELENSAGDLLADSGHRTGFELGGGVVFPIGGAWSMSPLLRYRSLPGDFDLTPSAGKEYLRYVGIEFAFSRAF